MHQSNIEIHIRYNHSLWKITYFISGHNEYSTYPHFNLGNFNKLLKLCINSGNYILKEQLLMCNKNAKYTSKTTQN